MNEIEPVTYVNVDGQKIDPSLMALSQPKIKRTVTKKVGHFGFVVKGIPPGALEDAEAHHELLLEEQAASLRILQAKGMTWSVDYKPLGPWSETEWPRKATPKRAHKPFEIPEAAHKFAELVVKAGWLRVTVTELKFAPPKVAS